MDTHMPTTVTTMARDPLMLSQRLMLMPSMDTMDMDITLVMPTMDTTDTHMPTTVMPTTERDLPMLMPTTDTHTLTVTDMPTMDTMDTHMPTTVTTMARDPLMLSQRLMLMPSMDAMDMDITSVMPTMDTTDTNMP